MEHYAQAMFEWLTVQAPVVAVLAVGAWRLEARLAACLEHTQKVIDALLEQRRT